MITPQAWSAYAKSVPVLKNRRQSIAFLLGMGLKPQALIAPKKFVDTNKRDLTDWQYVDTFQNWGCPLVADGLDVDVDVKTPSDTPASYTPEVLAQAAIIIEHVYDAFLASGLKFRAYGRLSLGCKGHFFVECPVAKTDTDLLRRLHMKKSVECEGLRVRIEVRRRPDKQESSKNFTLPGSVYEAKNGQGYDLIQWAQLSEWADSEPMPKLEPQPYEKLRLAMYMALFGLALLPMWEQDNRHHCAFHLAGALAYEWREGSLTEDECAAIMEFMIAEAGDNDPKDRMKCWTDALAAMESGGKVTGYKRLVEEKLISEEWKNAILTMRGGGDPDSAGRLFDIVARINKGVKKANVYADLSVGAEGYVEMDATGLRHRFRNNPEFPDIPVRSKMVPAIEVVMHSKHIQTYAFAVSFPGIPFRVRYTYDPSTQEYVEVPPDVTPLVGEKLYLNVASGFTTKPYADGDAPDPHVFKDVVRLWWRLRRHLTCDDPEQADKLDQILAWKLQRVREKQPVGCALVGGPRIGKTFLFDVMLSALIGDDLIKKSGGAELKSEKRFTGIERALFLVVEECRFDKLPADVLQMVKDVMRNRRIFRDAKWGEIGAVSNVAVPFFLSNELNPRLSFDGVPDRALVIIRGDHQASLEMTAMQWEAHQDAIHIENGEFAEALKREDIRRALLHYFLELELKNDIFSKNESAVEPLDFEEGMSPIQAAVVAILREGHFMPLRRTNERGPSIQQPFALETLAAGLRERLKDQRVSTFETSPTRAAQAVAELFRENTRARGTRKSKGTTRSQRDKVLKLVRYRDRDIDKNMYYFGLRRGALLKLLEERTNLVLVPDYTLDADGELGEAPEPSRADLAASYRYAAEQQQGFGARFGIV